MTDQQPKALLAITLGVVVALVLIAIASYQVPGKDMGKLWLEVFKSALNFLLIAIIGGLVSHLIRQQEKSRDEKTARQERERQEQTALQTFRADLLRQLLSTFHRVKDCRRRLRRGGLTNTSDLAMGLTVAHAAPAAMTQNQLKDRIKVYGESMDTLNSAQLDVEILRSEVKSFPKAFSKHEEIQNHLKEMESYLRDLLYEYQRSWQGLLSDPPTVAFEDLQALLDYTGNFNESDYLERFIKPKEHALMLIREDILPLHIPADA